MEEVPEKEIGLVLGAAAYGDRLSDILKDRVDTAIELFIAKKVSKLMMSGADNEAVAMKNYAVEKGVPEESILEDPAGINTLASIENSAKLGGSVIIVSQKYHLPRALYMANHYDIDAVGFVSDKHEYAKMLEFKKRELMATTKAVLDLTFGVEVSLGSQIESSPEIHWPELLSGLLNGKSAQ